MEYIILDLEWDSVYFKKTKGFINQILQIGAVKLDENFELVDTFSETICSEISHKVSSRFAKLTGITSEKMRQGIPFIEAVRRYNEFSKGAFVTMTWSDSDLYSIIENEEQILNGSIKFEMKNYLDLQKLVQSELYKKGYESKNQISLEGAAELLGFDTEGYELHTALDDCKVCALMFKACYNKEKFDLLLRDTSSSDFYKRLKFKAYAISDLNDSNINKKELEFNCPKCGKKAKRLRKWKYRNRWFMNDFECGDCKYKFSGRVAFKKTFDDLQVKHRVLEYKPRKKVNNEVQVMSEKV